MSQFDNPEFKRLKAEAYKRLSESGFEDIEDDRGRIVNLDTQDHFSRRHKLFRSDEWERVRDYYTWAVHCLQWATFESRSDEMIWVLHAEGASSRDIAKQVCLDQTWVCRKIKVLRKRLAIEESSV